MGFFRDKFISCIANYQSRKLPELAFKSNFNGAVELEVLVKKNDKGYYEIKNKDTLLQKMKWLYSMYIVEDKSYSHTFMLIMHNTEFNNLNFAFIRRSNSILMKNINIPGMDICKISDIKEESMNDDLNLFIDEIEENLGKLRMRLLFIESPSHLRSFADLIPYHLARKIFLSYYKSMGEIIEMSETFCPSSEEFLNKIQKEGTII